MNRCLLFLALGVLWAGAAEARSLRDRGADQDKRCEADALPAGAGVDPCALLPREDAWRTTQMPLLQPQPAPELKPLWVPPLAPSKR